MKKNQKQKAKIDARLILRQIEEWEDQVLDGMTPEMFIMAAETLLVKAIDAASKDRDEVLFHITRTPFELWMTHSIIGNHK